MAWAMLLGLGAPSPAQDLPVEGSEETRSEEPRRNLVVPDLSMPDGETLGPMLRAEKVRLDSPRPGVLEYFRHVIQRALSGLIQWAAGGIGRWAPWLAVVFEWATYGLLIGLALIWILLLWGRRRPKKIESGAGPLGGSGVPSRGPEQWQAELERRLAAGDGPGALIALWWWWATVLGVERVDDSWTTRELIAQAGRQDLRGLARRFDFLAYGDLGCGVDEVEELWGRLRRAEGKS